MIWNKNLQQFWMNEKETPGGWKHFRTTFFPLEIFSFCELNVFPQKACWENPRGVPEVCVGIYAPKKSQKKKITWFRTYALSSCMFCKTTSGAVNMTRKIMFYSHSDINTTIFFWITNSSDVTYLLIKLQFWNSIASLDKWIFFTVFPRVWWKFENVAYSNI